MDHGKTYCMSIDIEGILGNAKRLGKKHLRGFTVNGFEITPDAARKHLEGLLASGAKVMPLGECDNFDDQRGCLGHTKETP